MLVMSLILTSFVSILLFVSIHTLPSSNLIKGTKPLICGLNEEPTDCVEPCLPTCDTPKTTVCTFNLCLGGCVCRKDYIRKTEKESCVPVETCVNPGEISRNRTVPHCEENEVLSPCASNCQATCQRTDIRGCTRLMCAHGCVCRDGYVRKEIGGSCVLTENCKSTI